MNKIKLNHWYIKENELSISLMRFYVSINILKNDQDIYYQLYVKDSDENDLTFNFYTLEDATTFTEEVISKSCNITEVRDRYINMFVDKKFKGLNNDNDISSIELTPNEVDEAIISYFGQGKSYRVSSKEKLQLINGELDLKFYLIEHIKFDGVRKDIETMLTEGDLKNALNHYINFYGYELVDFKYMGGIHRVGYAFSQDTPHYDGIYMTVKERIKDNQFVLSKDKH